MVPLDEVLTGAIMLGWLCLIGSLAIRGDVRDLRDGRPYTRGLAHGIGFVGTLLIVGAGVSWLLLHVKIT